MPRYSRRVTSSRLDNPTDRHRGRRLQVILPDGTYAHPRRLIQDRQRESVDSDGHLVDPEIARPDAINISIGTDGMVSVVRAAARPEVIGEILLVKFMSFRFDVSRPQPLQSDCGIRRTRRGNPRHGWIWHHRSGIP